MLRRVRSGPLPYPANLVLTVLFTALIYGGTVPAPATALDTSAPRAEEPARVTLRVRLAPSDAWTAIAKTIDNSQGYVLASEEEIGFVSFFLDLRTHLFPWDFINANLLVRLLANGEGQSLDEIRSRLSPETKDRLLKHPPGAYPSHCLLSLLAEDLNRVISGAPSADEVIAVEVGLQSEGSRSEEHELKRRSWVEEALPNTIRPWRADPGSPWRIVICNVLVIPASENDASMIHFSSWQVGAPTTLSRGNHFFESLERVIGGGRCSVEPSASP